MRPTHIISFGRKKENLEKALEKGLIGSKRATFSKHLFENSLLLLHCDGKIWAKASIAGAFLESNEPIWEDATYPFRFPISVLETLEEPFALCDGKVNTELRKRFGTGWAYSFIFAPKALPSDIANWLLAKF